MNARRLLALWLLAAVLAACGQPSPAPIPTSAASTLASGVTPTPARGAALHELVNLVEARPDAAGTFAAAQEGQSVGQPNEVRTGEASKARLDFTDGAIVRLAPNTLFVVDKISGADEDALTRFKFALGKLWVSLTNGQFQAETPVGVATVRGSYAEFQYDPGPDPNSSLDDVLTIKCIEGTCTYTSGTQTIVLGNLEQIIISNGGQTITGPTPLPASAVADFIANSPESTAVVLTLTAAAPSLTPSRTPSRTVAPPSPTPSASATRTQPPASATPSLAPSQTATTGPTATRTRRPSVATFTATASETLPPPTPTPTDTATNPPPPPPPNTDTPTATATETATATPTPSLTPTFTPTVGVTITRTPTRTPGPTKTPSPTP